MRRALLILLSIVLPLKAAAALVVPIVGPPALLAAAHSHAAPTQHGAHADGTAEAAAHCCCHQDTQDRLHEHGCPHLAMAVLASGAVSLPVASSTGRSTQQVGPPAPSVVLDVPCPPPTA